MTTPPTSLTSPAAPEPSQESGQSGAAVSDARLASLDDRLLTLLHERTELVRQLGHAAAPEQAAARADRLAAENPGPLPAAAIRAIFRELASADRAVLQPPTVAYFGPAGTYTHQATLKFFGHGVATLPQSTIVGVFNEVETGHVDYGVVPVENSTEGAVTVTFDLFPETTNVTIVGEIYMRIRHNLLTCSPDLAGIRTVYSHPQALAQCRGWLQQHLPGRDLVETAGSTTASAQRAVGNPEAAAIAGAMAAELTGLPILHEGIEDIGGNTTRFLVLSRKPAARTGVDKTSIMFAIKDRVGALYETLLPFKESGVSLTMIQSRPSKRKSWDYHFYVDFIGHADDPANAGALKQLAEHCNVLKILGSYPRTPDPV